MTNAAYNLHIRTCTHKVCICASSTTSLIIYICAYVFIIHGAPEVLTKWDRLKTLPEFQENPAVLASPPAGDVILDEEGFRI